jgi:hypothetical protein
MKKTIEYKKFYIFRTKSFDEKVISIDDITIDGIYKKYNIPKEEIVETYLYSGYYEPSYIVYSVSESNVENMLDEIYN